MHLSLQLLHLRAHSPHIFLDDFNALNEDIFEDALPSLYILQLFVRDIQRAEVGFQTAEPPLPLLLIDRAQITVAIARFLC